MKKNKIIIISFVLIIIGSVAYIYLSRDLNTTSNSLSPTEKHAICVKYNTVGLRSGSCIDGAPSYCTTVYYPPSCKECQDAQGCGYITDSK